MEKGFLFLAHYSIIIMDIYIEKDYFGLFQV